MSNLDAPLNNTPYSQGELEHFKKLLQDERKDTRQTIDQLQDSLENIKSNRDDESSAAAHHQGDIASEEDEREKFLLMLEKEKDKMDEITAAFDRIELGTYGVCEETGQKIKKERLEAIPHARYSMASKN